MPAHIIYGDTFLVAQRLQRIRADAGASDLIESNHHRVLAAQTGVDEVTAMCNSMPFLDAMRLIELEGALGTQEASGGNRRGGRGRAASRGGWDRLADVIPAMPDTTLLILVDGELNRSNSLLRSLSQHCQVHAEATPSGPALLQWIKNRAESKGASITPPAIQVLADLLGGDLWGMDRELEKLSLYATGRDINDSDVRAMVPLAQEANIFAAVDAIIDGQPVQALRLMAQLMRDGQEPLYIIAMIQRQLRLLAIARDLSDRGVPQSEMGERMGTRSDFVVRKTLAQARRRNASQIRDSYKRVLASDLAIKQGRLEPAVALELLVAELATGR